MGNFAFFLKEKRTCVICGREYEPDAKSQKTCCMECRREYYRRNGKGEKQATVGKNKPLYLDKKGLARKKQVEKRMKPMEQIAKEAKACGLHFGAYKEKLRKEGRLYAKND